MRRGHSRFWFGWAAALWLLFFSHSCSTPLSPLDPEALEDLTGAPRLQIGLSRFIRVPRATVIFRGPFRVVGSTGILHQDPGGSEPRVLAWEGGLRVGDRVFADSLLRLTAGPYGEFELDGASYPGDLLIVRDDDRETNAPRITLVNEVDLEDYLKGVVGKEMSLSAGEEALKAQVIAARTYALAEARQKTLRTVRGEKFDLYDDERSQVYAGRERATALAGRLVEETRGVFLTYMGRVFKAYFSSTCGGHTEPARLVLGDADDIPPLKGAPCGYCGESKYYRWRAEFPRTEIAPKLFANPKAPPVTGVRVTKTLPGGHAQEVAVALERVQGEKLLPANDGFRRRLDPRVIRSTLWESIRVERDRLVIEGRGWGHAVGMCQWGAYRMAALGRSAAEILGHYYPQAEPRKLY